MASPPAIRHVASSAKSAFGYIHLQCHVKPGASKQRQGIISVSNDVIEVCVSAQPKDGEANKAVREVFSDVGLVAILSSTLLTRTIGVEVPKVGRRGHSWAQVEGQDGSYCRC
jgi:hypothetical protein